MTEKIEYSDYRDLYDVLQEWKSKFIDVRNQRDALSADNARLLRQLGAARDIILEHSQVAQQRANERDSLMQQLAQAHGAEDGYAGAMKERDELRELYYAACEQLKTLGAEMVDLVDPEKAQLLARIRQLEAAAGAGEVGSER